MPALTLLAQITNPAIDAGVRDKSGADFFSSFLSSAVTLALVVGALVFFFVLLLGGIKWMTAGGDKAAMEAARGRLTAAFIGLIIVFATFAIIRLIDNFFGISILQIDINSLIIGGGDGVCIVLC